MVDSGKALKISEPQKSRILCLGSLCSEVPPMTRRRRCSAGVDHPGALPLGTSPGQGSGAGSNRNCTCQSRGWGRGGRVGRRLSPMARPGPESRAGSGTSARTQGPGRHGPLWSLGSLVKVGHTCLPPTLLAPCAVFKQTTSQKKKLRLTDF